MEGRRNQGLKKQRRSKKNDDIFFFDIFFLMWIFLLNFLPFSPKIKQISNVILPNVLGITKESSILSSAGSRIL